MGDSMYNEDVKSRFLSSAGSSLQKKWVFEKAGEAELALGKDLSEMNRSEALSVLSGFGVNDPLTAMNVLSAIRGYVRWVEECENREVGTGFSEINASSIDYADSLRGVLFTSEDDLLNSIRVITSFSDGVEAAPVLLFAWIGLSISETLSLKNEDVDLVNRTVVSGGFKAEISEKIADALAEYRSAESAKRDHGVNCISLLRDNSTGLFVTRMLPPGSSQFGIPFTKMQMDAKISRLAARYTDLGFKRRHTFTNAWRSGVCNRLLQAEKSGSVIDKTLVSKVTRGGKGYYPTLKLYEVYKKI